MEECAAQGVLEQGEVRAVSKYMNMFFWRMEVANGNEL